MSAVEERLKQAGINLPEPQEPVANYVSAAQTGNLIFLAGAGPAPKPDGTSVKGKLGRDLGVEDGCEAARLVGLVLLARLKEELGDLDRVKRVVKLLALVDSTPDFTEQPAVVNACSDLLVEAFGDRGRHARSAVGMSSLPFGIPVEIEMIVEVQD